MAHTRQAVKLKRFQKELIKSIENGEFTTPTEIAMRVYDCKSRDVAKVIASQNLTKLNLSLSDLMNRMGLTDEQDIEDLKRLRRATKPISCNVFVRKDGSADNVDANGVSNDFVEVDDNITQLKALELTLRLKRKFGDDKQESSFLNLNLVNLIEKVNNYNITRGIDGITVTREECPNANKHLAK